LKKRESIIIVIALLAAGYGALDYLVLSRPSAKKPDTQGQERQAELAAFVQVSQAQLATLSGPDTKRIRYRIEKAEAAWENDPFEVLAVTEAGLTDESQGAQAALDLHYSGYIKAGSKAMAVINGMEYNVGDLLLDSGYMVAGIFPDRVVLVTETSSEILIPLEEN
jgi:hypothetical protein